MNPSISIDWQAALRYASYVKLAESVSPNGGYDTATIAAIGKLGLDVVAIVYGDDLAPAAGEVVTFGYVAINPATLELVVALRGTATIFEWIHDAEFLLVKNPVSSMGLVDDGFAELYRSLRVGPEKTAPSLIAAVVIAASSVVKPNPTSLVVTGHSLGASLATLFALDASIQSKFNQLGNAPSLYTFASPRVGDHGFATRFNAAIPNSFRVANRHDLVTMLPTVAPLPYEHVGELFELIPPSTLVGSIPCEHHLTSYLAMMAVAAGESGYAFDADCQVKNG